MWLASCLPRGTILQDLEAKLATCIAVAAGGVEGKSWRDDLEKSADLEVVQRLAKEHLLGKQKADAHKAAESGLKQACICHAVALTLLIVHNSDPFAHLFVLPEVSLASPMR